MEELSADKCSNDIPDQEKLIACYKNAVMSTSRASSI